MEPCPVCGRPVEQLGTAQDGRVHGFVVHISGTTYVVHNRCLSGFIQGLKTSAASWSLAPVG